MTVRTKLATALVSIALAGGASLGAATAGETSDRMTLAMATGGSLGASGLTRTLLADPIGSTAGNSNLIEEVQYRRGRGYRGGRGVHRGRAYRGSRRGVRGRDVGIGLGLGAAAIIGGIAASQAARANQSAMQRCAARFRSFDWDTGTYVTYGGEVRICPYLR